MPNNAIGELEKLVEQKRGELAKLEDALAVVKGHRTTGPESGITLPAGGKRRRFSTTFKERILDEIDNGRSMRSVLEEYGLYASHVSSWRKQLSRTKSPPLEEGEETPET